MSAMFSIIIPVYNVAPYLRECLDSVLAQTCADWECICVDDGSTDGSAAILDEYAAKDPRFKVIHQANAGVSAARNAALDVAQGEWILFLDGDDLYDVGALMALLDVIDKHSVIDGIKFGYVEVDCASDLQAVDKRLPDESSFDISLVVPRVVHESVMWQCAYRASTLGRLRFDRAFKDGEDNLFVRTYFLTLARSVVVTSTICYGYRQRQGSQIHRPPTLKSLSDHINHRIAVLKVATASPRKITGLYDSYWMRRFFAHDVILLILHQSRDSRKVLLRLWRENLPFLCTVIEFPSRTKSVFRLCSKSQMFFSLYILRWELRCWYEESILLNRFRKVARYILRRGEFSRRRNAAN